jgi:ribosomal protein L37AE/L43A
MGEDKGGSESGKVDVRAEVKSSVREGLDEVFNRRYAECPECQALIKRQAAGTICRACGLEFANGKWVKLEATEKERREEEEHGDKSGRFSLFGD